MSFNFLNFFSWLDCNSFFLQQLLTVESDFYGAINGKNKRLIICSVNKKRK
jgi:hypothetical protein